MAESLAHQLQEALAEAEGPERYLDLCLILRRARTKETLLWAGGQWDRAARTFTEADPEFAKIVDLEESQIEFTRWFATWLQAFREGWPRDISLALAAGERRAGKTFDLLLCALATLIDVPEVDKSSTLGWVVSANYQERDEIDKTIREVIPAAWYRHWKAPEHRYQLANGATLRNVSADDPETLKRGRVDVVLYNEAQKMPVAALSNGIYGTADKGGIALLAANPPRRRVGEWLVGLKEAIDERVVDGAKFFGFSAKDNTKIDQPARGRIGDLLRLIDPKAAKADDEGAWLPVGDRAYHAFKRVEVLAPFPDVAPDVTEAFLRRRCGRAYLNAGGADFQGTPHHAGVVGRLIGAVTEPTLWIIDELIAEQSTEDDFLDLADEKGYAPESLLWVGDASGQWQDGKHNFSGGRASFEIFKRRRWHVVPPTIKKTDRGEFSKNPHIDDRLNLVNKMLGTGHLRVDPNRCPRLAEALKECPLAVGKFAAKKPYGVYSHITDALGYLCYWLFPPTRKMVAPRAGASTVAGSRRTLNF